MNKEELRGLAESIITRARDDGIRLPTDDTNAREAAGASIMSLIDRSTGTVDIGKVLDGLQKEFGSTKNATKIDVECEENRELAEAIKELANYSFKTSAKMQGIAYTKAAKAIAEATEPIMTAKQAMAMDGVGKSTANKIVEFRTTGVIEKLEEFRATGGKS